MCRRMGILILVALMILSGCASPTQTIEPVSSSESVEASLPEPPKDTVSAETEQSEPVLLQEVQSEPAAESETFEEQSIPIQNEEKNEPESADRRVEPEEQSEPETTAPPRNEEAMEPESDSLPFQEVEPPQDEEPPEKTEPVDTAPFESSESEPELEPVQTEPEPETQAEEPEPKPDFDISYWISYAMGLAESKGLRLDASATDCWDNPITANPDCIYLERDLNSRLNRYANDEEITDVWIWYEDLGNQHYLIYIGYA